MIEDDIAPLWDQVDACVTENRIGDIPRILADIEGRSQAVGYRPGIACVTLYRHMSIDKLPTKKPEMLETQLRQALEVVENAGDGLRPFLPIGHMALTRYYILRGDFVRANESYQRMQRTGRDGRLDVHIFRKSSIDDLWEQTLHQPPDGAAPGTLEEYIHSLTDFTTSSCPSRFGDYVTDDAKFISATKRRFSELAHQIKIGLSVPENFLLEADPGSGKSFFVLQVADTLPSCKQIVHNLAGYRDLATAFDDLAMDILISAAGSKVVLSLIDEADSKFGSSQIFERFIGPMNGEPFFLHGKRVEFSKLNLVFFFALSSPMKELKKANKAADFLSRIPAGNQIKLPDINLSYKERLYRAAVLLKKTKAKVTGVVAKVLFYIGLRKWRSTRELEQLLKRAVGAMMKRRSAVLELGDLPVTANEIIAIQNEGPKGEYDVPKNNIFAFSYRLIPFN